MNAARILVSTFGSAGDLFPLLPVIRALREDGHDVRCATSRSLGLYLRSAGIPTIALGDGSEVRVVDDPTIFTTAGDGWESWRQTVRNYVLPSLEDEVEMLGGVFEGWRPHITLASGMGSSARLASYSAGVPVVEASIYPQHTAAAVSDEFSREIADRPGLQRAIAKAEVDVARALWGAPADLLLHDPVLLGPGSRAVGFPYWDDVPVAPSDAAAVDEWAGRSGPKILVTLGSFVGIAQRDTWLAAAEAAVQLDVATAFIGPRGIWADETFGGVAGITVAGFVPLSRYLPHADAVVHHGGIGTTFAALHAQRPAVIVPQAFDQSANARLVEAAGIGYDASERHLGDVLERVLNDDINPDRLQQVASAAIDGKDAVAAVVDGVLDAVHAA